MDHQSTPIRMRQAITVARRVPAHGLAPALGRCRGGSRRRSAGPSRVRRRHPGSRRAPRRGDGAARRPGRPRRGRRSTPPSSPAATPDAPARAPTRSSRPAWPGSWSASLDPDPQVAGDGDRPARAGPASRWTSASGPRRPRPSCAPYLHHRRTGRPYVVLKLAATLDGRTAAPDGTSQWITGAEARPTPTACGPTATRSLVGAGTVRADDPALTVRLPDPGELPRGLRATAAGRARPRPGRRRDPARPRAGAAISATCSTSSGRRGVLQVLVEGGASVAHGLHAGRSRRSLRALPGAGAVRRRRRARRCSPGRAPPTMADAWRGRVGRCAPPGRRSAGRSRAAPTRTGRRLTCSPESSRSWARWPAATAAGCASRATHRARRRRARRLHRGQRVLPHRGRVRRRRRLVGGRRHRRDLRPHRPRRSWRRAIPVNLERPSGSRTASAATSCRATSTPSARSSTPRPTCRCGCPTDLLRYVVEKGSITVDGVSLTVVDVLADGFTVARHPAHRGGDDARRTRARATGEPRGRRDRQVHRAPAERPARRASPPPLERTP